jgi:predicted transcriptional regulator
MSRSYIKAAQYAEEVFQRKKAGETNREIGESLGLTKEQVKQLVIRQNRKARRIANGSIPRTKGRPAKTEQNAETKRNNELILLRMQEELLRNVLSEAGRR